jgi:hypothetical protein
VLQFLVRVVQQDRLELGVVGVVGALIVPIDGLELFHQRRDGVVHLLGMVAQLLDGDMKANARHAGLLGCRPGKRVRTAKVP